MCVWVTVCVCERVCAKQTGTRATIEISFLRLVRQGEIELLDDGKGHLVRRAANAPNSSAARNPGRSERSLGDGPTRTYVPMLSRP